MPRPTFPVLLLLALWLLPACRTVPNAAYCEVDMDCDNDWTCNDMNTCVPPSGAGCMNNGECALENEPICDLTEEMPACRGCVSADECMAKNPGMPFCSPDGACTAEMPPACIDSDDCTALATAPICDMTAEECKSCNDAGGDAACELRDSGNAPYCVTEGASAGACAVCLDSTHCTEATPVCNAAAGTCGACKEHSDCAAYSGVCDAGACADESTVVYIRQMNSADTNDCSKGAPCTTITRGLDAVAADNQNKLFIRILDSANYSENISLAGMTVSLIGSNGTRITGGIDEQAAINMGSGTSLTLDTLTIRSTGIGADGVSCPFSDSTLRIENVIVRDNANLGIYINRCRLELARSIITANAGGGIDISNAAFSIANSFIVGNGRDTGTPTSNFGGVRIANVDPHDPQFFAFNTIAQNRAGPGASASGVQCSVNLTSTVTATSNILRKGFGGKPTLSGDCVWRNSNIEEGDTLGDIAAMANANNYEDCGLADDGTGIHRFTTGSPCDNGGEADTGINVDYEGQPRPATPGTAPDMGADEIVQAP